MKSRTKSSVGKIGRAAIGTPDREDVAIDDGMRQRVAESLADPKPSPPARTVFSRLRVHHAKRLRRR